MSASPSRAAKWQTPRVGRSCAISRHAPSGRPIPCFIRLSGQPSASTNTADAFLVPVGADIEREASARTQGANGLLQMTLAIEFNAWLVGKSRQTTGGQRSSRTRHTALDGLAARRNWDC